MLSYINQEAMQQSSRDPERPFKAYPRTLPVSFYGTTSPHYTSGYAPSYSNSMSGYNMAQPPPPPQQPGASSSCMMGQPPDMHRMTQGAPPPDQPQTLYPQNIDITSPMASSVMPKIKGEEMDPRVSSPRQHSHSTSISSSAALGSPIAGPSSIDHSQGSRSSASSPGEQPSTSDGSGGNSQNKLPIKKRPNAVPNDKKDGGYWEKRKKNNESAKRSRDARRMKEEQIAMRVVYLEQENLQLRTEVSLLKSEIEKLRCMLYNS